MAEMSNGGPYTRTELVWPGKRTQVDRVALPFQRVETVNAPRGGDLFSTAPDAGGWRNKLIWGDNKLVMGSLLQGDPSSGIESLAGKIDLIYIDPPFDTGADFSFRTQIGDEELSKEPSIIEQMAYRDAWGRGTGSYLQMMYDRLMVLRDLLSENGSVFVHVGPNISHHMKLVLDSVFGDMNYRNEIVVKRRITKNLQRQFNRIQALPWAHDVILWYSRTESARFPSIFVDYESRKSEGYWHHFWSNADRPTMRYELLGVTPSNGQWKWSKERALQAIENYNEYLAIAGGG